MKNLRKIFFLGIVLAIGFSAKAQKEEKESKFDKSRLFFGGNLGLSFGDQTFINISPQVGYQFSQYLAAGGGINFISSSFTFRDFNGNKLYKDSYSYAGLNIFARVFPLPFLFAQVQPEYNYSWGKTKFFNGQQEIKLDGAFVPVFLVGAGAAIPAGRGRMIAMMQYDLIGNVRSPYGRNIFFSFGYYF